MDFNSLVDEHQPHLFYYVRRFKLSKEKEFDLIQETWLAFFERPEAFQNRSSVRTFLISILVHKVYSLFRQEGKLAVVESDHMEKLVEAQFASDGHWKDLSSKNPFEHLEEKELAKHLEKCKEQLSPLQQLILVMKEEGISGKEMALKVEKTETNLRQLISRLNHQLRFCLQSHVV